MLLYNIFFLLLLLVVSIIKGHVSRHNFFNISMGIINTQTVIACRSTIDIYSSFNPAQIIICPYVSIQAKTIQLVDMKISKIKEEVNIHLSPKSISSPVLLIKHTNGSFIHPSNFTQTDTYYFSFSSELTCRFSSLKKTTICFYYPLSMDFSQIEHHFDKITNLRLVLSRQRRNRFIIIFIIIGILVTIVCFFALYILCTSRLPFQHRIQLDYIIDPKLAKEAALKLGPEPM
jgi:hypothetical protein